MLFLIALLQLLNYNALQITWEQTEIEIELHSDIMEALNQVEAILWVDGKRIDDARVIYRYDGVERTFLSTINTSIVRTYQHKIEAYFPDYAIRRVATLTIRVVDITPPVFLYIPEVSIPIHSKMPDLLQGVRVSDNYHDPKDLTIRIDSSRIQLNRVGIYDVIYTVEDLSGNLTKETRSVAVVDHIPPEIKLIKALVHPVDIVFRWETYFKITDQADSVLIVSVDSLGLEEKRTGTYAFFIKAVDQSGNETVYETSIELVDLTKPTLKLSSDRRPIAYGDLNFMEHLLSFIADASDNYDSLTINDVIIETNLNPLQLGTYLVVYKLSDQSGHETIIDIQVKVTDQDAPVIIELTPLLFDVFSTKPNFTNAFMITDNLTPSEMLTITYQESINMNLIGRYPLIVIAKDQSGNEARFQTFVTIIDQDKPVIQKLQEIHVTSFSKPNFSGYYDIRDNYDQNLTIWINDGKVNYNLIGIYPMIVFAKDSSGNEAMLEDVVYVVDIIAPVMVLSTTDIYLEIGEKEPDYRNYIVSVYDNYDELDIYDVLIKHDVNRDICGRYTIRFTLIDQSKNRVDETIILWVLDRVPPKIKANDVIINQFDQFNLMDEIELLDQSVVSIQTFPKSINTSLAGSVIITYVAIDAWGNETIATRKVTIVSVEKPYSIRSYVPSLAAFCFGATVSAYLYIKREKHLF